MKVKELFISRFENGKLIEVDFKQIEVVVAAHLANDRVLKHEVINGIDLHTANAQWVFNKDTVTKEERQTAKDVTFGVLYGAGRYKLAQTVKVEPDIAQEFIDKFYTKYYGIADWHCKLMQGAGRNKTIYMTTPEGRSLGECKAFMDYGKNYVYYEKYNEKYDRISFNPPDIKNYPVQGMAGDILRLTLGDIYRSIRHLSEVKLINTVHDSIMFDAEDNILDEFCVWMEGYFCTLPGIVKEKLDSTWELPLRVDIKVGDNWGNLKEV